MVIEKNSEKKRIHISVKLINMEIKSKKILVNFIAFQSADKEKKVKLKESNNKREKIFACKYNEINFNFSCFNVNLHMLEFIAQNKNKWLFFFRNVLNFDT